MSTKINHIEIHNMEEFLKNGYNFRGGTIQNIDFTHHEINWKSLDLAESVFLGCRLTDNQKNQISIEGATIFPEQPHLSFNPYRSNLYSWQELYEEIKPEISVDLEIYNHFSNTKFNPTMMEALYQLSLIHI